MEIIPEANVKKHPKMITSCKEKCCENVILFNNEQRPLVLQVKVTLYSPWRSSRCPQWVTSSSWLCGWVLDPNAKILYIAASLPTAIPNWCALVSYQCSSLLTQNNGLRQTVCRAAGPELELHLKFGSKWVPATWKLFLPIGGYAF